MAFVDLREFISALEKSGELCIVKKQASPRDELAAVIERTIARRGRRRASCQTSLNL